jgi:hypothetical protein
MLTVMLSEIRVGKAVLARLKEKGNFIFVAVGITLLLVVPGPKIGYFDGIPLSDINEIIGLLLVLVALVPRQPYSQDSVQRFSGRSKPNYFCWLR